MSLEVLLGVVAAVLLLGVLAVRVSVRLGLPSLLLYLGIGILLGEAVLGVQFSNAALTENLGIAALVLILVEGGLTTRWQAVRPYAKETVYVNYVDAGEDARFKAAYGANYERLAALKATYDPANFFRHNHNVRPAVAAT